MSYRIDPLTPDDLPELSAFLAAGFGQPPDAEFAAPDVLRWKFLDVLPDGDDGPRSWIGRDEQTGAVVGHVGVVLTSFLRPGGEPTRALHMIDWLGSSGAPGVGTRLMMRAHQRAPVQYVLGGSDDAQRTIARAGYLELSPVPVYRRALNPLHRLRDPSLGPMWRVAAAARDVGVTTAARVRRRHVGGIAWRTVDRFGPEVDAVLEAGQASASRVWCHDNGPAALNRLLGYPRGGLTGWVMEHGGAARGFALTRFRPDDPTPARTARLVELAVDGNDPDLPAAAADALAVELRRLGADAVTTCAATRPEQDALHEAGFDGSFSLHLYLRDRGNRLSPDGEWPLALAGPPPYVSFLDADYAHSP